MGRLMIFLLAVLQMVNYEFGISFNIELCHQHGIHFYIVLSICYLVFLILMLHNHAKILVFWSSWIYLLSSPIIQIIQLQNQTAGYIVLLMGLLLLPVVPPLEPINLWGAYLHPPFFPSSILLLQHIVFGSSFTHFIEFHLDWSYSVCL